MYENIQIECGNFCLGPQIGTFATIDYSDVTHRLRIINTSGAIIKDYTLSFNLSYTFLGVEYVGPRNLTAAITGLPFITVERINEDNCIIRKWELDENLSILNLVSQVLKTTAGTDCYDINAFAVENYTRSFYLAYAANAYNIRLNNTSRIASQTKLLLGPSTHISNYGALELVNVNYVEGSTVYLSNRTLYAYRDGDPVTFYPNIYLFSNRGYTGDIRQGTLFQLDAATGAKSNYLTKNEYRNIECACWSQYLDSLIFVRKTTALFVKPYEGYTTWRSMFLNNVKKDNFTILPVSSIKFDDINVYKLMKGITLRTDVGSKIDISWTNYNYWPDTISLYTNSVEVSSDNSFLIGQGQTTTLKVFVKDQFGVALRDVQVNFSLKSGDNGYVFDPLNGQVFTDISGEASVDYTSGNSYDGQTVIAARAEGGSSYNGSEYVWNTISIFTTILFDVQIKTLTKENTLDSDMLIQQESNIFYAGYEDTIESGTGNTIKTPFLPRARLRMKSLFTYPVGDWIPYPNGMYKGKFPFYNFSTRTDGVTKNKFDNAFPVVKTVKDKDFKGYIHQISNDEGHTTKVLNISNTYNGSMHFSQLHLSRHFHYINGVYNEYLIAKDSLNAFRFVDETVPAKYSEKNSIATHIWVRLLPYSAALNPSTFKFYVTEAWSDASGVHMRTFGDVTSLGTIESFVGGGLEFYYQPAEPFGYNSVIYVTLEVYDTAAEPNRIGTEYWFTTIADYKAPYLINLSPGREDQNISVDRDIYFEIKDDGTGINMDTLEVFLNSRRIVPTLITAISSKHYQVTINLPSNLQYDKRYSVSVNVEDFTSTRNTLRDNYRFYTMESADVIFDPIDPMFCKRGTSRRQGLTFIAAADKDNLDEDTLRIQFDEKDITDKTRKTPIIYRIS